MAQASLIKVLCIEDEPEVRDITRRILELHHYSIVLAGSIVEAQAALHESMPDVILLDVNLPGASGLEMLRDLRSHEETRWLPVLLVTGKSSPQEMARGLDMGATDVISKPINYEVLLARLKNHLLLSRRMQELKEHLRTSKPDACSGSENAAQIHAITMLNKEVKRAARYKRAVSWLLIEVHSPATQLHLENRAGALVLAEQIMNVLNFSLRTADEVFVLKGSRYLLLLPETPMTQALQVADRLRDAMACTPILHGKQRLKMWMHCGVASLSDELSVTPPTGPACFNQAEQALAASLAHGDGVIRAYDGEQTQAG